MTKEKADGSKTKFKPGTILNGKYELKAFAGRGGMGEVWRAWDHLGGRYIALKFITTDKKKLDSEVRRMQEAFRATSDLNHQNICPSYGLELDKKCGLYLAMKWLDGNALNEVVAYNKDKLRKKGLPPKFSRRFIPEILRPIAAALDYSHGQSVVHRDVKPSNVFLEVKKGKILGVYLIDFGLASLIREGDSKHETSGTLPYMPPEQWKGGRQDGRTDQYSLAVIAYELYAGKLPFFSANVGALRYSILYDAPPPIKGLPDELNKVLAKGLSKEMNGRYGSCSEFVAAVERAAKGIDFDDEDRVDIYSPPKPPLVSTVEPVSKQKDATDDYDYLEEFKGPTFADKALKFGAKVKRMCLGNAARTAAAGFCVSILLCALVAMVWFVFMKLDELGLFK